MLGPRGAVCYSRIECKKFVTTLLVAAGPSAPGGMIECDVDDADPWSLLVTVTYKFMTLIQKSVPSRARCNEPLF
jgi:hypothetical protein